MRSCRPAGEGNEAARLWHAEAPARFLGPHTGSGQMSTRIRRPWWAFLLALLFSVVVALLYVGRPRRALAYVAAALAAPALGALGIWSGWAWSVAFFGIAFYGVALVAAIDAFRIARSHRTHFEGA